ncbi:MAG: adenylosuccinate synthetase, partial [Bacteroidetes bacterium]|nr:adenylosuccinate synthetase [Bacteroidota bacterium]
MKDFTSNLEILENCDPVYESVSGWKEDISSVKNFDGLPKNTKNYVKKIENLIKICPGMDYFFYSLKV